MTTIAYKDGIIAYDSRATAGTSIISDDREKRYTIENGDNDVEFFMCGAPSDFREFFRVYFQGGEIQPHLEATALVWDGVKLFHAGIANKHCYSCPVEMPAPWACGSGEEHAITAMDMGATAKEAVKWAMKRDTGTGGRIRTYKLKEATMPFHTPKKRKAAAKKRKKHKPKGK